MSMGYRKRLTTRWNLIEERRKRGLTPEDVADALHYSAGTIRMAENGRRYSGRLYKSGREFWQKVSDFYGKPIDYLMKQGKEIEDD